MESIKISVEVSVNLSESTQSFIKSLFTVPNLTVAPMAPVVTTLLNSAAEPAEPTTESAKPAEPQATKPAKPTAEPAKPAKPTAEPAKPVEPQAAPAAKPSVSIEDVRQELVKKVNAHREEIKAKLTEFGAPSVTKLDPSKYEDMYNFLTSL